MISLTVFQRERERQTERERDRERDREREREGGLTSIDVGSVPSLPLMMRLCHGASEKMVASGQTRSHVLSWYVPKNQEGRNGSLLAGELKLKLS